MTREDIEKALHHISVAYHPNLEAFEVVNFALAMVAKHNDECAEIVNAARYEGADLRSLVSRIREASPKSDEQKSN